MNSIRTRLVPELLRNTYLTYPLYPFSLLYGGVVRLWILAYQTGVKKKESLSSPVISVGNIVAGGTGKTGFVLYLARFLEKLGKRVCVLTRGYGGRRRGIVSSSNLPEWGDEALLLRAGLPDTPILTGKDRVKTGKLALERFDSDVFILDDGFQYLRLNRDLNILLIDATDPFGGKRFPPCGLLREPLSSVCRADVIIFTRVDQVDGARELRRRMAKLNPNAPLLSAVYKPLWLEEQRTQERMSLEALKGREIVAFSSIGNPMSFERQLESLGALIIRRLRFPDHHLYNRRELGYLRAQSRSYPLLTTEKDSVKLSRDFPCSILKVEMVILEGREVVERRVQSVLD
jgi:tetraacyldisaccharide 4'-kinase